MSEMITNAIQLLMQSGMAKEIDTPEPDHVYWLYNPTAGKLEKHTRAAAVRQMQAFTLQGLREIHDSFAGSAPVVFVGGGEILLSLDEGDTRRSTAVMKLAKSTQFSAIERWPHQFSHRMFLEWLTTQLHNAISADDVNLLRNLNLSRHTDADRGSQGSGHESIGRKTLSQVTASGGELFPEYLLVNVAVYDDFPKISAAVECSLVVDCFTEAEEAPTLSLMPRAGELIRATQDADRVIAELVREFMPESVGVVEGKRLG